MLTDEEIDKWMDPRKPYSSAKAIERAVMKRESALRKDDESLIRQLWDLVQSQHDYIMALPAEVVAGLPAMPGFDGEWADEVKSAATARLEKAP